MILKSNIPKITDITRFHVQEWHVSRPVVGGAWCQGGTMVKVVTTTGLTLVGYLVAVEEQVLSLPCVEHHLLVVGDLQELPHSLEVTY